ncbi:uncharacterized protein CLUP02_04460 [Colletotrichum lupini]|uniref:Uncharacterized protein n=1 Tax=Colletotrichum lupini TaxID=145971 RepID=A0A9Q8WDB8_9PEZI|nr:uncharacterized protein CLUP02_04460 [Colletotrichum lupini]KAK1701982.1 hypothetical protein BDP67DRAFT_281699 [Colletotrichum lupini]UQC78981.1 hypothetical protein CLUP02_04460 [Colletotrichum lupini]
MPWIGRLTTQLISSSFPLPLAGFVPSPDSPSPLSSASRCELLLGVPHPFLHVSHPQVAWISANPGLRDVLRRISRVNSCFKDMRTGRPHRSPHIVNSTPLVVPTHGPMLWLGLWRHPLALHRHQTKHREMDRA